MFENGDTLLETVLGRYKLGLDHLEARQFERPLSIRPDWRDRFLFKLGKMLVDLGSRLQQRHASTTPAPYRPAYPAG